VFNLIEKLRQKPDGAKKRIAFLASFSFSVLILGIWFSVIYPDFKFKEKQKQSASVNQASPASSFFENILEGFSGVKKQLGDVKNLVGSISTTTFVSNPEVDISTSSVEFATSTEESEGDFEAGI
jgi:hypothetical protein